MITNQDETKQSKTSADSQINSDSVTAQTKSETGEKNICKCNEKCNCNTEHYQNNSKCHCMSKLLPLALSILSCIISLIALNKGNNKTHVSPVLQHNSQIDNSKIKSIVIDVIKNDPQMLIDAMSAGIAKQRSDMTKQQAQLVNKYKKDLIHDAYVLGRKNAKTEILCLFDPLCGGCIEFQQTMLNAINENKDICFYILPVAALGEKSETIAKIYYSVQQKYPNKFVDFIREIVKDPSDLDKALKTIAINKSELSEVDAFSDKKIETNRNWLDTLRINSVPAVFVKSSSGKFTSVEEEELVKLLK